MFIKQVLTYNALMNILGIESSCDDTGLAIIDSNGTIIGHITSSQHDIHEKYGGIVPELASRDHVKKFIPLLEILFERTSLSLNDIDLIAFTNGPGLLGPLLTGVGLAKSLAWTNKIPIVEVNHLEAHIYSPMITENNLKPPFISLLVSGGHTILSSVDSQFLIQTLGATLDDSAGECFDKIARKLGLGYPGGPSISKRAELSSLNEFDFPRPMIKSNDFNFSFSGLKTHALKTIQENTLDDNKINNISSALQEAIIDVLICKTTKASQSLNVKNIVVTGGVSANTKLRENFSKEKDYNVYFPDVKFSTDNGVMIAYAGYLKYIKSSKSSNLAIKPNPSLTI